MELVCSKQIAMCKKTRNKDYTVCYIELGNNPAIYTKKIYLGNRGLKKYRFEIVLCFC